MQGLVLMVVQGLVFMVWALNRLRVNLEFRLGFRV